MNEPQRYDIPKILEQMRADYWRNLETAEEAELADRSDYLVVTCGGHCFGLPASACREVLKLPRIVKVPRLPRHLPGIINLRGEIVAVTDLRPLLQLDAEVTQPSSRLVVIAAGTMRTALLVEGVAGMRTVSAHTLEALTDGALRGSGDLFRGKVEDAGGLLLLLDVQRLLARPELMIDQKHTTRDTAE